MARPVKLYNHAVAPNPPRVRIFAAEKSIAQERASILLHLTSVCPCGAWASLANAPIPTSPQSGPGLAVHQAARRRGTPETMSSPLPRDYCERRSAPRPTTRSATRVECIDKKGPPSSALRPAARRGASPDPISHGSGISFGRVLRGAAPFLLLFYFATVRARKLRRVLVLVVGVESQNIF